MRSRTALALTVIAAVATGPGYALAERPELGAYEKQALEAAVARLGLALDLAPEGKRVGAIHVLNLDVFSEREGFLQWFNVFHRTTREHVIEREVLLRPGDMWDDEIVAETKRKLQDPLFTTLVVLHPVKSAESGRVDLLVVTRDIWSLRMNSTFEVQGGKLTELSVSLSENNVLGFRKHAAFVFDMNQGQFSLGPQYIDKNILGSRLVLTSRLSSLFSRQTQAFEGTSSLTALEYPLWALSRKWGGSLVVSHFDSTIRQFFGTDLRTYDNPDTAEVVEAVPRLFDFRRVSAEARVVRSFGEAVKHRVSFGHSVSVRRPVVRDDFGEIGLDMPSAAQIAEARTAFERDVLPRSERISAPFVSYTAFTPRFIVYRDMDAYDLPENARLGPNFSLTLSSALRALGSENNFIGVSSAVGWTFDIARDGFFRASANAGGRIQRGDFIDGSVGVSSKFASPRFAPGFRVVGRAAYAQLIDDTNNQFLSVGGNSGLRGFAIAEFTGRRRLRTNLELRSRPFRIWFARAGGVMFYDIGHAADRLRSRPPMGEDDPGEAGLLDLQHDVGIGFRSLVPQLQPFVFRFDYAIPLTGVRAGFPGRFTAGVAQAF